MIESTPNGDSFILLGDFNVHVGNDSGTRRGMNGSDGHSELNPSVVVVLLLDFCASHSLYITNSMFKHKSVHKCIWHPKGSGCCWTVLVDTSLQHCLESGEVPLVCQIEVVVPLFKTRDRGVCFTHRGITCLSLPGKIYAGVLEKRVRSIQVVTM